MYIIMDIIITSIVSYSLNNKFLLSQVNAVLGFILDTWSDKVHTSINRQCLCTALYTVCLCTALYTVCLCTVLYVRLGPLSLFIFGLTLLSIPHQLDNIGDVRQRKLFGLAAASLLTVDDMYVGGWVGHFFNKI